MKKFFYFMSMVAIVAALAACNQENKPQDDPTPEDNAPTKIAFTEAFQEFFMMQGESIKLTYTVSPSSAKNYTLEWKSDDESVATVDKDGVVEALKTGEVTITLSIKEYPDVKAAKSNITVLEPIEVGDFLYSDGSWGNKATGKDIIAVVYWLGNPTLFDPILEADYPNCTHGLAMSLKQGTPGLWQKDYTSRFFGIESESDNPLTSPECGKKSAWCREEASMAEWGMKLSSYKDQIEPYLINAELRAGDGYCGVGGYTYTYVMEEFQNTDPDAAKYPLEIYTNTLELVKNVETPLTTSRWYIPSIFEAGLMVNTALTKPSDFNKDDKDGEGKMLINHNNDNLSKMNNVLSKISGADQLPTKGYIASATDLYFPYSALYGGLLPCEYYFMYFGVTAVTIKTQDEIDAMTADEKTKYETELAEANARWQKWLKEESGLSEDDQIKYANATHQERGEIFLAHYEFDKEPYKATVQQMDLSTVVFGFTTLLMYRGYETVDVETGMQGTTPFTVGDITKENGQKGSSNNEVIRAIIAF